MFGRRLSSFSFPFVASLLLAAAAGATTLAVVVSPQRPGTAKTPRAQSVNLTESQIGYANGRPSQTLIATTEQFPASFRDELARFAECPASDFSNVGNSPPPCPSGSELGTTSFTAYVPSLLDNVTANGYMYKVADDQVDAWVHITQPATLSVAIVGRVAAPNAGDGPSVAWDLSAAVDFGVTADITSFQTVWSTQSLTVAKTAPTTSPAKKTTTKKKKKKKKAAGKKHAAPSRKRTSSGARTSSPRPKESGPMKARTAGTPTTETVSASAFESTGCPSSGSWDYSATLTYKSGSSEVVSAAVSCASTTTPPATGTVISPSPCLIGIICLPPSDSTALQAGSAAGRRR